MNKEKYFAILFNEMIDFSYLKYLSVKKYFGSLEGAFKAKDREYNFLKLNSEDIAKIKKLRKNLNAKNVFKNLEEDKIKISFVEEENYPILLKFIYSPPILLYYQGNININWHKSLSIVGSRDCSNYPYKVISDFMPILKQEGINIVSGLAIGVDTIAHQEALKNNCPTIAVLGAGINNIYPAQNKQLAQKIIEKQGLLISEFKANQIVKKYNFPRRNRIIAGLSSSSLIIEARKRSGSLITAKYALEESRNVLAVASNIYNQKSQGSNNLIQSGAIMVNKVEDILALYYN